MHKIIHGFLGYCVEQGLTPRNVAELAHPPRPDKVTMSVWNERQAAAFIDYTVGTS